MDSFLKHIAKQYKVEHSNSLKDICFVFPSRRASLYFKEILKDLNKEIPFWAPPSFSIEEFVQQHNKHLLLADNLQLILKLFNTYKSNGGTEKFDEFYSWGTVLLNDFDQIDRYLLDGEQVYRNLQNVDNLESTFGPSEELISALKSFKKVIDDGKDGRLTKTFVENWLLIGKIYKQFKTELSGSGKGYMGMLYRNLADQLKHESNLLPYSEIIFAGFNALSKSEDAIISKLLDEGKARLFFDADRYYLDNDKEEAGKFLRRHKSRWYRHPKVEWVVSDGFKQAKKIQVIGIEQQVAQTRAAAELINDYGEESTAIVMGDESLISPMLYALPQTMGDVNITMGYPVAGSSLANLVRAYFKYQDTIITTKSGQALANRESLSTLITQPALSYYVNKVPQLIKTSKSTFIVIEKINQDLQVQAQGDAESINPLLAPRKSIAEAIDHIISFLAQDYYATNNINPVLVNGIRFSLLKYLKSIRTELLNSQFEVDYGILDKILRESLKQLSTPFSGEPLAQLQIMGFLESRALDFKNLILLSVNEDVIPAGSGTNSYIPFNIRKAFGLPTFVDQNSIYAYHFFRLLQRAENITLIYNSQLSVTGGGEQSRFIYQLIERTKKEKSSVKISRKIWSPRIPGIKTETPSIIIPKSGEVSKQIETHLDSFRNEKTLTPTQLTDYITCSLKYYYARILKIREEDRESDKIDARTFGNLLHELLETCYTPWINKKVTAEEIKGITKELPKLIETLFKEYDNENGETRFTKNLIHNLAELILKNDLQDAPIFIHDLESKTKPLRSRLNISDSLSINIGGLVDRLDMIEFNDKSVHRVLDYKTGKSDLRSLSYNRKPISDEDYVDVHFADPTYKSGFQLLFYILVLKLLNADWQINAGIIGVRKLNTGIDYLRKTKEPVSDEIINIFERQLKQTILEITNTEIPFKQTEDTKRCEYCQYRRICER